MQDISTESRCAGLSYHHARMIDLIDFNKFSLREKYNKVCKKISSEWCCAGLSYHHARMIYYNGCKKFIYIYIMNLRFIIYICKIARLRAFQLEYFSPIKLEWLIDYFGIPVPNKNRTNKAIDILVRFALHIFHRYLYLYIYEN